MSDTTGAVTSELHPAASALSMFRVLPSGEGRAYSVVEGPRRLIQRTLHQARALGFISEPEPGEDPYAVLDVLDDDDDIVQDYAVRDARAFRWLYRRLGLRVDRP